MDLHGPIIGNHTASCPFFTPLLQNYTKITPVSVRNPHFHDLTCFMRLVAGYLDTQAADANAAFNNKLLFIRGENTDRALCLRQLTHSSVCSGAQQAVHLSVCPSRIMAVTYLNIVHKVTKNMGLPIHGGSSLRIFIYRIILSKKFTCEQWKE